MEPTTLNEVRAGDLTLAYREAGSGSPVLLLHGWPTSSFLWRDVMAPMANANRVIALDLPGFGGSDKPLGVSYGFELFERAIDDFLAALDIESVGLAVHDLGGPIGVHWALSRPERVTKLAVLNTLLYPELSGAVLEFVKALSSPELRDQFTSPQGLEAAMRLGLADQDRVTEDLLAGVRDPFRTADARRALADAGIGLDPEGFTEIARRLPSLTIPVRVVYGEQDAILPDIADTVARLRRELPQAEVTALPDCGHFLQEEAPEQIGELLARFFADASGGVGSAAWPRATVVSSCVSGPPSGACRRPSSSSRRTSPTSARVRRSCAPSSYRSIPPTAPGSARRRPTCRLWASARSCARPGWVAWSSRSIPPTRRASSFRV